MVNDTWQLQQAKSRFSELVETAMSRGAQTVTRNGKPAVVVISVEEYRKWVAPRKSLASALSSCPEGLGRLLGNREKRTARRVDLS